MANSVSLEEKPNLLPDNKVQALKKLSNRAETQEKPRAY